VIGTIVDSFTGNATWAPVTSGPVSLPRTPEAARKAFYTAVVVGPGEATTLPAAVGTSPLVTSTWEPARADMVKLTAVKEVILPTIFSAIGVGTLGRTTLPQNLKLAIDLSNTLLQGGLDVSTYLAAGDTVGLFRAAAKAIGGNTQVQSGVAGAIARYVLTVAPGVSAAAVQDLGERLNVILVALDVGLYAVDLGTVARDIGQARAYSAWEVIATNNVNLSPAQASASPGGAVTLTEHHGPVAGDEADFAYHFATPGAHGHLRASGGMPAEGTDLWVRGSHTVEYVARADAARGSAEVVTVEAFRVPPGATNPAAYQRMGSAQATVTVGASAPLPTVIEVLEWAGRDTWGWWCDPNTCYFASYRVYAIWEGDPAVRFYDLSGSTGGTAVSGWGDSFRVVTEAGRLGLAGYPFYDLETAWRAAGKRFHTLREHMCPGHVGVEDLAEVIATCRRNGEPDHQAVLTWTFTAEPCTYTPTSGGPKACPVL